MVSRKPSDSKTRGPAGQPTDWNGVERRRKQDRRSGSRRLDERRRAGIGEVMDDRRERGRRTSDFRANAGKRSERRAVPTRRSGDTR